VLSGEERRVINMHRNLERYLDLPESERISGAASQAPEHDEPQSK